MSDTTRMSTNEAIEILNQSNKESMRVVEELRQSINPQLPKRILKEVNNALDYANKEMKAVELAIQALEANIPKPIEDWGEDYGDCLWWKFPIVEPPYCGSPLAADFPDYVTHFTRFECPEPPAEIMKRVPVLMYYKDAPEEGHVQYTHIDVVCPYCGLTVVYDYNDIPEGIEICNECGREFEVFDCEHFKEDEVVDE